MIVRGQETEKLDFYRVKILNLNFSLPPLPQRRQRSFLCSYWAVNNVFKLSYISDPIYPSISWFFIRFWNFDTSNCCDNTLQQAWNSATSTSKLKGIFALMEDITECICTNKDTISVQIKLCPFWNKLLVLFKVSL